MNKKILLASGLCFGVNISFAMDSDQLTSDVPSTSLRGETIVEKIEEFTETIQAKLQITQEKYDESYIENDLLPVIRQLANHPIYENRENFLANRNRAGFKEGMSLEDFRLLVYQIHGHKLRQLEIAIPEYNPPRITILKEKAKDLYHSEIKPQVMEVVKETREEAKVLYHEVKPQAMEVVKETREGIKNILQKFKKFKF